MIKTSVTGKVFKIFKSQKFSDKFTKRTLVIQTHDQYNPHIAVDFINNRTELLEPIKEGREVTVFVDVYSRPGALDPNRYFNNITGWKIEEENKEYIPEEQTIQPPTPDLEKYDLPTNVKISPHNTKHDDLPF